MKWDRVLIDLSGTLHVDNQPIPGAVHALQRLRDAGLEVRFVTNTTKESKRELLDKMAAMGFGVDWQQLTTSLTAAADLVREMAVRPMLLLEDGAMEDFKDIDTTEPNAVVVGLAPSKFDYNHLNKAMQLLLKGHPLIGIHKGRYYQKSDGLLHMGPGAFIAGLEYSGGVVARVVGKPEASFFYHAMGDGACKEKTVMIGDDAQDDIEGALKAGLSGILVQTGKYREGDEDTISPTPTHVCADFPQAVHLILSTSSTTTS